MLKLKIDQTAFDTLPADIQKEYKKLDDGSGFILETDVQFEDVKPLKNALTEEKKHRKLATEKVTELEDEVEKLKKRAGDPSDLEASWQKKVDKVKADAKAQQDALTAQLRTVLVDNVAQQLASEISTAPNLILPHIKSRLTIEEADGKMITRVLDPDGKASATSVNELKAEIVADKQFAPIIRASSASGGGAQGGKGVPAGGKVPFENMSEQQKSELVKSNPAEFDRLNSDWEKRGKPRATPQQPPAQPAAAAA